MGRGRRTRSSSSDSTTNKTLSEENESHRATSSESETTGGFYLQPKGLLALSGLTYGNPPFKRSSKIPENDAIFIKAWASAGATVGAYNSKVHDWRRWKDEVCPQLKGGTQCVCPYGTPLPFQATSPNYDRTANGGPCAVFTTKAACEGGATERRAALETALSGSWSASVAASDSAGGRGGASSPAPSSTTSWVGDSDTPVSVVEIGAENHDVDSVSDVDQELEQDAGASSGADEACEEEREEAMGLLQPFFRAGATPKRGTKLNKGGTFTTSAGGKSGSNSARLPPSNFKNKASAHGKNFVDFIDHEDVEVPGFEFLQAAPPSSTSSSGAHPHAKTIESSPTFAECEWVPFLDRGDDNDYGLCLRRDPSGVWSRERPGGFLIGVSVFYTQVPLIVPGLFAFRLFFLRRSLLNLLNLSLFFFLAVVDDVAVKKRVNEPRPQESCGSNFGMPSGHAVIAAAVLVLRTLQLFHKCDLQEDTSSVRTPVTGRRARATTTGAGTATASTLTSGSEHEDVMGAVKESEEAGGDDGADSAHERLIKKSGFRSGCSLCSGPAYLIAQLCAAFMVFCNECNCCGCRSQGNAETSTRSEKRNKGARTSSRAAEGEAEAEAGTSAAISRSYELDDEALLTRRDCAFWLTVWVLLLFPVPAARVVLRDHTAGQVLVGSLLGIGLALVWFGVQLWLARIMMHRLGQGLHLSRRLVDRCATFGGLAVTTKTRITDGAADQGDSLADARDEPAEAGEVENIGEATEAGRSASGLKASLAGLSWIEEALQEISAREEVQLDEDENYTSEQNYGAPAERDDSSPTTSTCCCSSACARFSFCRARCHQRSYVWCCLHHDLAVGFPAFRAHVREVILPLFLGNIGGGTMLAKRHIFMLTLRQLNWYVTQRERALQIAKRKHVSREEVNARRHKMDEVMSLLDELLLGAAAGGSVSKVLLQYN